MSYSVSFYPDEINPLFPAKIFPPIHLSLFFIGDTIVTSFVVLIGQVTIILDIIIR